MYFIKIILFNIIDIISNLVKTKEKNEIILLKIDEIGDFIIWQDIAKEFKKIYKDKKITILCNDICADLAEQLPYFDFVIPLNKKKFTKNLIYRLNFLYSLKKKSYLKVIASTYSRDFFVHDWLVKNIRAIDKIGFDGDLSNISLQLKKKSDLWYTKLIKSSIKLEMEIIRNAQFIRGLGITDFKGDIPDLRNVISWSTNKKFKFKKKYIAVFLGASKLKRCWNPENFVKVLESLNGKYNIVLLGTASEKKLASEFIEVFKNNKIIINLVGKTNLLETMEIIKYSELVLGNESGAIHMATSLNIKSVVILGGGHFGRFMPYKTEKNMKRIEPLGITIKNKNCFNCNWKCLYSINRAWKCIEEVDVNDVTKQLKNILKRDEK